MIHSNSISMAIGILCKLMAESGFFHKATINFVNVIFFAPQIENKTIKAMVNGKLIIKPGAVPAVSMDLKSPTYANLTNYSNAANK